jgi:hypothetical protein
MTVTERAVRADLWGRISFAPVDSYTCMMWLEPWGWVPRYVLWGLGWQDPVERIEDRLRGRKV